jgi:FtsH-binding integral membrane protein
MPDAATSDWTVKAADTIDAVVGAVHDKAVVPVTSIARWVVYGLLAAIVGTMALVLTAIALVRVLDVATGDGRVWIAHLITGGIFTILGLFAWSKRSPRH